jgi:hypothetical protein
MCDRKRGENLSLFLIIRHGTLELASKDVFDIYLEHYRLCFIFNVE